MSSHLQEVIREVVGVDSKLKQVEDGKFHSQWYSQEVSSPWPCPLPSTEAAKK